MKEFSILFFLVALVLSSFSQAVFNEIYLADSSNYSLPIRSIETDAENNTYALFAKFDSGFRGYVLKKYSPDGVELASYERPSSTQLWAGEWKPFVYHEKRTFSS